MSEPSTSTIAREKDKMFVTDIEIIRRLGVPEKLGRQTLRMLDDKLAGFPKKQKLWGDRRYWPAVEAYFDKLYGGTLPPLQQRDRK